MLKVETVTKDSKVNVIQEKERLFLFLSFLYSVNNPKILNILKLFTKYDKNMQVFLFLSYINSLYYVPFTQGA